MEQDRYRLDSHKLNFHPGRVAQWLEAGDDWEKQKRIAPIYVEVSPIGACNHRCVFCALDYMGYAPRKLDADRMAERLAEMGAAGVKSAMFAGEGEPLLHKGIVTMARAADAAGIDTAFTTNGVLLRGAVAEGLLPLASWIKISLGAGTPETYARIHRTNPADFAAVAQNLKAAVRRREEGGLAVTLGVQMLLLPENAAEAETLAKMCRDDLGVDYLVIKPYSQHKKSLTQTYAGIDYAGFLDLGQRLEALSNDRFRVVFRARTMQKYHQAKPYPVCQAVPFFWAYVASDGSLCSCSAWLGDERFSLGNLMEASFAEVWQGERRRRNLALVAGGLDVADCRANCRMDEVNIYLWGQKNPPAHVNFI